MTVVYPDLAIIGRAGAGKTTVAEILVKEFGYRRMSFAAPLKAMCGTTTDRALLQHVGVGVRDLYPDAWVNLMRRDLEPGDDPRPVVIDDCRFPNEAQMLLEHGFRFVRVTSDRNTRLARLQASGKLQDEAQLEHVSETSLDDFATRRLVTNFEGPDELRAQVVGVLNREAR